MKSHKRSLLRTRRTGGYPLIGKPESQLILGNFQLLHKSVDSIEKKLSGSIGSLTLRCKDFQIYQLEIPSAEDCLNIASSVEQLSNIGKSSFVEQLLAVVYICGCVWRDRNGRKHDL